MSEIIRPMNVAHATVHGAGSSATLYTNSSGSTEVIAVRSFSGCLDIEEATSGTNIAQTVNLEINGVVVWTLTANVVGTRARDVPFYGNYEGAVFSLPNSGTVALVTGSSTASDVWATINVAFDVFDG